MTPWTCKYCTGTHYLGDNEAFGPCVCVTPETLTELREANETLEKHALEFDDVANALTALEDKAGEKGVIVDELSDLLGDVWDAWDDYCVQQGVGADAAGLDRAVRNSRPVFTRLWDQMQEIRRDCE